MSFLPADWRRLAHKTDALKGLRHNKSEEDCLRTLLIHLANGYSLRETALRAREAHLAALSDVALLKRLRKSEQWLYELCCELFRETHLSLQESGSTRRIRLVDATMSRNRSQWKAFIPLEKRSGVEGRNLCDSQKSASHSTRPRSSSASSKLPNSDIFQKTMLKSARAWLYGEMFVALLVEKLVAHANSVSPWGYPLRTQLSA